MIRNKFKYPGQITLRKETALVLRSQAYSDNDLILSLLSQNNGKISVIFKKARSGGKSMSCPEILDLGTFELREPSSGSSLCKVRSFKPEKSFLALRNNLSSFLCACAWIEAIDCLTLEAHHEASELFELALQTLSDLAKEKDLRQTLRILYQSLSETFLHLGYGQNHDSQPSLNNLKALAHQIEALSHRKLKSFDSVYSLTTKL